MPISAISAAVLPPAYVQPVQKPQAVSVSPPEAGITKPQAAAQAVPASDSDGDNDGSSIGSLVDVRA